MGEMETNHSEVQAMAYSTPNGRQSAGRRHQGRVGEGRAPLTSSGKRAVKARGGSPSQYRSGHAYRTDGRGGTGYSLRRQGIGFSGRRGGLLARALDDRRSFPILLGLLALIVILALGATTCARGCTRRNAEKAAKEEGQDTRVSTTVSASLAEDLSARLDQNELLSQIAQNADKVPDPRLIELALAEPTAIELVAGYVDGSASEKGAAYGSDAYVGSYPKLYDWDKRWGYVTYNGAPLALTGSGPTSLAMAYIGLTGKTDQTPATLSALITQANGTDTVYGTSASYFLEDASSLGLQVEQDSASGETLADTIESGTVILLQLRERSLTDDAHWALAVSRNLDGSINVYDPTSSSVTEHPWDPDTIAAGCDAFYILSAASVDGAGDSDQ